MAPIIPTGGNVSWTYFMLENFKYVHKHTCLKGQEHENRRDGYYLEFKKWVEICSHGLKSQLQFKPA